MPAYSSQVITQDKCFPVVNSMAFIIGVTRSAPNYAAAYMAANTAYGAALGRAMRDAERFMAKPCPPSCNYKKFHWISNDNSDTKVVGAGNAGGAVTVTIRHDFTANAMCTRNAIEEDVTKEKYPDAMHYVPKKKKVKVKKKKGKKLTKKKKRSS